MKNILWRICGKPAQIHSLYFTLVLLLISAFSFAQPDTWKQKQSLPGSPSPRVLPFTFSIGAKGYMGGGFEQSISRADFWEYDPATGAWTEKASFRGGPRVAATGF